MNNSKTIGIVMVNFNGAQLTIECINSLNKSTFQQFHIYIVDNGSKEEDVLMLKSNYNEQNNITLFDTKKNNGIAKGNNIGISAALQDNCKYIMLLNNDTIVDPLMLEILFKQAENGSRLCTPLMFYYDDPNKIWCAGGKFNLTKGTTKHLHEDKDVNNVYLKETLVDYVPTCCLLIDANLFEVYGNFDESYFLYYDDTDFIYRLYQNQHKIRFIPTAKLWHKVSSTSGGAESKVTIYYSNRNRLYFINKNLNGYNKVLALLYSYSTRLIKLFNQKNRKVILEAIKDYHSSNMGWKDIGKI